MEALIKLSYRATQTTCDTHMVIFNREKLSSLMTKPTKWHVRPANSQTSLGIYPVWSVFAGCTFYWFCHEAAQLQSDTVLILTFVLYHRHGWGQPWHWGVTSYTVCSPAWWHRTTPYTCFCPPCLLSLLVYVTHQYSHCDHDSLRSEGLKLDVGYWLMIYSAGNYPFLTESLCLRGTHLKDPRNGELKTGSAGINNKKEM